ncbi:hypothetical protein [Paraliomyxa miuraensis]|uniref:hypothetical protein n=1 Tax=Paraliomyxa miuraensis TaxID=376150 RepID=UPI0022510E24|nr:hypothetical protein [Paraliomyxa miuraensis]MCX4240122.1 hypothetical protein [Paraliomyxa miuraensis]
MSRGLGIAFSIGTSVLWACGDDGPTVAGDGTGTTSSASTTGTTTQGADETASVGTSTTSGDGDGGSTTTGAPEAPLAFASGIRLTRLTANQGVQVDLVDEGLELPPSPDAARLISGRTTLLRAFWSLHADFTPRELIGRLEADYPDGTQLVQDFSLWVEGEGNDGGTSFQWLLQPHEVVPGIQYRVRLLDPDPTLATGQISDPPPILPLASRGTLSVYDAPLQLRVELVPVLHQFEGEECMPTITDQDVQDMREELEQCNAVQEAILTVGEPMPYLDPIGTSGTGFGPVLTALAERRAADDPPPNLYYYGLLAPCDGYPPGLLGQAIGIPPTPAMELAQQRIATGRWSGSGAAAAETFVHEIGHTQGRYHVLCSGGEAGADMAYPHPQGRIGVWGFGIHDFKLRSPTGSRDYMTYCSNEWVSDYGWEQTLDVIEVLTSWDAMSTTPGDGVLMGALHPDGTERWWTATGALPASLATPGAAIEVTHAGGVDPLPAWIYVRPDGDTVQIIAPRPASLPLATALHLRPPDRVAPLAIDPAAIHDHFAARARAGD